MLVILWLGGILLCAVPYLLGYVLSRVDRDAARPLPLNPEPPRRAEAVPTPPASQEETW